MIKNNNSKIDIEKLRKEINQLKLFIELKLENLLNPRKILTKENMILSMMF